MRHSGRTRISDIADRLGVSTATVSRALSDPSKVSPETLARIREAIAATGFVPNALAGALASPVRAQMRADVDAYPPYQGGVSHFTMLTEAIGPSKKEPNHAL